MANQATTTYKVTGTRKAVNNLWNTFQSMEVNNKNIWLSDLAKHYGIDYEAKQICVRGHIYWAEYEEYEDVCLLSFETETAWEACNDIFFEIDRLLGGELSISYRCCECGCEIYYTHDERNYFPEDCCVSASGKPFEELSIIKADNIGLRQQIQDMNSELDRLSYHPFFRGIGNFKGFTQDSLVMKQAHGYKEVYESWILLQCGYDLQDGIMQLEVKDISELYEIWCFIKIKNIVNHILGEKAELRTSGNQTEGSFIKNLIQGKASDVSFIDKNNVEVVLASVMYNATSDDEAIDEFDPTKQKTDIIGTTSKTTEQRPDIVLRLSKSKDTIQYTYLFDAKYRLNDTQIFDCDVPPVDAINQLHRYRDAIYYTQSDDQQLKKEVVGGFVLYPGNLTKDQFNHSYYKKSIDEVNIGAYPLKPGNHWNSPDSELLLSIDSSEDVLYNTIKNWLNEESPRQELLENTIPQRGLEYTMPVGNGAYLLSTIDSHVNEDVKAIESGNSEMFVTGYSAILAGLDFQKIKFFAPVVNHMVAGYYIVSSVNAVDMKPVLDKDYNERVQNGKDVKRYKGFDKTIRIRLELGKYKKLEKPFIYGLDSNAAKGVALTRSEFNDYVKNKTVNTIDKV